jgi:CheY-like chemotaxis protein
MIMDINKVLLIDDDSIFNFLNKKIIELSRFAPDVSCYTDPKEALDELKRLSLTGENSFPDKNFPDIIFLDINMQDMDGWEFLDEYEKLPESSKQKCRVFMLSSSIDPSDIEKAKTYRSVKDFISKPLSEEILNLITLSSGLFTLQEDAA